MTLPGGPPGPSAFAGVELDDLLAELRSRAGAAREAHDRMRERLDAVVVITADLDLASVLRRIVAAACALADARYGALGVVGGTDRRLSEFVTHGMTSEQEAQIGDLPRGHGVLGLLIDEPQAVRLHDIGQHERSYGFPPNHPPMGSFLGVPVRASGVVFGNLYLSGKRGGGDFTAEDEEVVVGLAAAAGTAVEKARLYAESQQSRRWLEASAEISGALLSPMRRADVLALVARLARETAQADVAAVLLASDPGHLVVEVADGRGVAPYVDTLVPIVGALAQMIAGGPPVLTTDVPFGAGSLSRALLAPLRPDPTTPGALVIGWWPGHAQPVEAQQIRMAAAFAEQAALALELARGQADRARVAVYEDRDRIARDLHDSVVQRLFAAGLSLRGVARDVLPPPERTARVVRVVDDLDATVKEIRRTIFRLHRRPGEGDLEADLEAVAAAAESALGFAPELHVAGVTSRVPVHIAEHVLAVAREALSNVARHADARAVRIDIDVLDTAVHVVVVDDGRGIERGPRSSGLANMAQRAAQGGGTFQVSSPPEGGTRLEWSVPLTV